MVHDSRANRGGMDGTGLRSAGLGVLAGRVLAVGAMLALAGAPVGAAAPVRKCVGVFVTNERRDVAADSQQLVVIGIVPCAERGIISWSSRGVYRAFDDGSVEFLATPIPPCPGGDAYGWIRYPNPVP